MKFLKITLLTLLALAAILAVAGYAYVHAKKPDYAKNLRLPGLKSEVEVLFDEHGIPHIFAQNEPDAYFALGFCHAQDRLFQMEMLRRLATGHLSELVGDKALETDKFFRTLSLRQAAKRSISALYHDANDPAVAVASAYVAGINQYLAVGKTPLEFDIMGIPKTKFTTEDCLVVAGYMGFSFSEAFKTDPICEVIRSTLGEEYLQNLVTGWDSAAVKIPATGDAPVPSATETLLQLSSAVQRIENFCRAVPPYHGSNSWVLGPGRTKSGKVLFENDTHIGFGQPAVWYEADLHFGNEQVYGNFIAGAPLPPLGHSGSGAWGMTMFENDDADFYRETLNPENPNQVRFRDGWEDLETRLDTIKIKGAADVIFPVKKSRHGYLMNAVVKALKPENQPVAFWWTYYQRPDNGLHAFYQLTHARDVKQAAAAVSLMHAPGVNVMWGDTSGNIAWWAAGLLPIRPAGQRPYLILDGASGADELLGWLPFEQNPHSVNPPSGFVYSANNQPEAFGKNPLVPGYYVPEDRARVIAQALAQPKNDWTAEDDQRLQMDNQSQVFPGIVAELLRVLDSKTTNPAERKALTIMQQWTGSHRLDDVAPTIFYRWLWHFDVNTFRDELGAETFQTFLNSHVMKRTCAVIVKNDAARWWDDISTPGKKETRKEIFEKSWAQAMADLTAQLGAESETWTWKRVHFLEHQHPLAVLPGCDKIFNCGPFPVEGGRETVNNLDFWLDSTGIYRVKYGPALRRIVDFGAPEQAMSVNPTGQSGVLASPFYDDQAQLFATGQLRHEWTRRSDIERVKSARLVLVPL